MELTARQVFENELEIITARRANLANDICRANYDDGITRDELIEMEAEFDQLAEAANVLVTAILESIPA